MSLFFCFGVCAFWFLSLLYFFASFWFSFLYLKWCAMDVIVQKLNISIRQERIINIFDFVCVERLMITYNHNITLLAILPSSLDYQQLLK